MNTECTKLQFYSKYSQDVSGVCARCFLFALTYNFTCWHCIHCCGIKCLIKPSYKKKMVWTQEWHTLIEKDHLGDGVLRRTVICDWHFDSLCGSHIQSQVTWSWRWLPHRLSKHQLPTTVLHRTPIVLVENSKPLLSDLIAWSIYWVAFGKCIMWLAVKTCAEIGHANWWVVRWVIK